jgi:hypothetical protein
MGRPDFEPGGGLRACGSKERGQQKRKKSSQHGAI